MASVALKEVNTAGESPSHPATNLERLVGGRSFSLKRSGGQPLRFTGEQIAEAIGHSTEGFLWHEINIYNTSTGEFAVELRVFKKDFGAKDVFYAEQFETLDQVINWIETYDATQDVVSTIAVDDPTISTYELTLQAASYRLRADEARRAYGNLAGELLQQICDSRSA